jgi:tight adherence protein B
MVVVAVIALWSMIGLGGFMWLRLSARRERTYERFEQATRTIASQTVSSGSNSKASDADGADESEVRGFRRLSRNWIWLPWFIGIGVSATTWLVFRWPVQYVVAVGAVVSLLLSQLEGFLHTRHIAILERQLADAIDIMVGAVGAGAGVGPAIDAAMVETDRPLKLYLEELSGRIRLGDEPLKVFRSLAERVPLETFLLFASSLAVHFEVGGRLAPTLATVGRTIRDRIEVTRRIQSNIAQSQFSTFAILGLVYLIALIVWRNGPEPMREFVTSTVGSWFVAGSIIMQAVGIAWMNFISKPRF